MTSCNVGFGFLLLLDEVPKILFMVWPGVDSRWTWAGQSSTHGHESCAAEAKRPVPKKGQVTLIEIPSGGQVSLES